MSNDSGLSFNPEKNFLGNLCHRGHKWGNTGQSARMKNGGSCKECQKEHYAKNRDQIIAKVKRWKEENSEYVKDWYKRYKVINAEKIRFRSFVKNGCKPRFSRIDAPHQKLIKCRKRIARSEHRRRTLAQKNHDVRFTPDQLCQHLSMFAKGCVYCDKDCKPTLDHFIPISRGGSNCLSNFVPACKSCNSSKNASDPKEWFQKQPFYNAKRWKAILKALGKTEKTYSQIPLF